MERKINKITNKILYLYKKTFDTFELQTFNKAVRIILFPALIICSVGILLVLEVVKVIKRKV